VIDSTQINEIRKRYQLLESALDERQRRLWAAGEVEVLSRGGRSAVVRATGLAKTTVLRGLRDIRAAGELEAGRIRRPGGGRKRATVLEPGLAAALDRLVEPTSRGDPQSPLRWTCKSTRRLGEELRAQGYSVSHSLVAQLLKDQDYSLQSNRKTREGGRQLGRNAYPTARSLLILADGGGSNGARVRLWKWELQRLADETGLAISVWHLPPGTSKWNKIEHRLFSFISQNWRGQPLLTQATIVSLIGATRTATGLRVRCVLDRRTYPKKVLVSDEQMATIRLARNRFHGEWNYTIQPRVR